MVSAEKKQELQKTKELMEKYPLIGIVDLYKLPSRQLQSIRKEIANYATIKMVKKSVIIRAFEEVKDKPNLSKLAEFNAKKPTLILSSLDPFKLYKMIEKNKSPTYAKVNDISTSDIIIPEGPTKLLTGPAIGDLQRVKIPALVKEGRIHVKEDTLLVKKGQVISAAVADILKKLDIQPMEIRMNLIAVWENGNVFSKDVLAVDESIYIANIQKAYAESLNLAVYAAFPTKESIKLLIQKAYREAKNLGVQAEIIDKGVIGDLIAKANAQARLLHTKIGV